MQYLRSKIKRRIKELRHHLESNGDSDMEEEFEALHKLIDLKLPKDYEPSLNQ